VALPSPLPFRCCFAQMGFDQVRNAWVPYDILCVRPPEVTRMARGSVAPSAAVRTRLAGLGSSSRHFSRTFSLKNPHSNLSRHHLHKITRHDTPSATPAALGRVSCRVLHMLAAHACCTCLHAKRHSGIHQQDTRQDARQDTRVDKVHETSNTQDSLCPHHSTSHALSTPPTPQMDTPASDFLLSLCAFSPCRSHLS